MLNKINEFVVLYDGGRKEVIPCGTFEEAKARAEAHPEWNRGYCPGAPIIVARTYRRLFGRKILIKGLSNSWLGEFLP